VAVAVFGAGIGVWATVSVLAGWPVSPGWASIMVMMCLLCGAILISNGILGSYVGRIFEESKGRPLYVVSYTANLDGVAGKIGGQSGVDGPLEERRAGRQVTTHA
jgi:dolichol-phosphate mannosyltransferase